MPLHLVVHLFGLLCSPRTHSLLPIEFNLYLVVWIVLKFCRIALTVIISLLSNVGILLICLGLIQVNPFLGVYSHECCLSPPWLLGQLRLLYPAPATLVCWLGSKEILTIKFYIISFYFQSISLGKSHPMTFGLAVHLRDRRSDRQKLFSKSLFKLNLDSVLLAFKI